MRIATVRQVRRAVTLAVAATLMAGASGATPQKAQAWGAIAPAATHAWIDEQAWSVLTADPAFDASLFPTKAQVLAKEGVNWSGTPDAWFDFMVGAGPDSAGNSPFSWHYYNPRLTGTDKGGGPAASAGQYAALVAGQAAGNVDDAAKGAAWGAHFMSDMYVPYHIVGMPLKEVQRLYKDQGGSYWSWNITLPPEAFGPIEMCYGCGLKDWSWLGSQNFKTEVYRYLSIAGTGDDVPVPPPTPDAGGSAVPAPASGKTDLDWFDPWYYNGTWPTTIKTSSHIAWEGLVSHDAGTVSGYDARWVNAKPNLDSPYAGSQAQVEALAIAAATETSSDLAGRLTDTTTGLNHAIKSSATIWRASFSALRPSFRVEPAEGDGAYKVTAVIDNKAAEEAAGVQVRLRGTNCSVEGPDTQTISGTVKHDESLSWTVKAPKPAECSLTEEVIGTFSNATPDLGYARTTKPLLTPEGVTDVVFCIDVTSSMEDDIASVKASAAAIVDKLAAKDPGFRVGIVAYRDWPAEGDPPMFEDYRFSSDRDTIIGNINSLSVAGGGDDPEAVLEALMRAINGETTGPWRNNVSKTIILMGDAPSHDPSADGLTAAIVAKAAFDADPIVIEAIVVGNGGDVSSEAAVSLGDLATRSGGATFTAENADEVVEAISKSIDAIAPPAAAAADPRPMIVIVAAALALLALFAAYFISNRRRRPAYAQAGGWAQAAPPVYPQASYPAPSPAPQPAYPAQQPYPTTALLIAVAGQQASTRFPLVGTTVIGSAGDCTIVLPDIAVAANHAQVYPAGAAYAIADLGSASGTYVNGVRLAGQVWLRSGDIVVIGPYSITFQA